LSENFAERTKIWLGAFFGEAQAWFLRYGRLVGGEFFRSIFQREILEKFFSIRRAGMYSFIRGVCKFPRAAFQSYVTSEALQSFLGPGFFRQKVLCKSTLQGAARKECKSSVVLGIIFLVNFSGYQAFGATPASFPEGLYRWPVADPFQIGAQFHDFQNYSGVPYLHGGMDIRVAAGTSVNSPVAGKVSLSRYRIDAARVPLHFTYARSPFWSHSGADARYVEAAVTDSAGRTWYFRHLDASTIPSEIIRLSQEGGLVQPGTILGSVVSWNQVVLPPAGLYHHVHLEIVGSDGYYLNPENFLAPRQDTLPPKVHGIWFVRNEEETTFPQELGISVVDGDVDVIAAIDDQIQRNPYVHTPYRVRTRLLSTSNNQATALATATATATAAVTGPPERPIHGGGGPLSPALGSGSMVASQASVIATGTKKAIPFIEVYRFDKLPIKGDRTQLASVIYKERIKFRGRTIASVGDNGPRFFLMTLTNGDRQRGYDARFSLPTFALPNGKYIFEIEAQDFAGNIATAAAEFIVRNGAHSP